MSQLAFIHAFISDVYGVEPVDIHPVFTTPFKQVVRITISTEHTWLLKARRHDLTPIGPPFDLSAWLAARALLLDHLAMRDQAAPRVVRTLDGRLIGTYQQWRSLVLTYLPGRVENLTVERAYHAAQYIASLHQRTTTSRSFAHEHHVWSWWNPQLVLPKLRAALDRSRRCIPTEWAAFHHALEATLQRIERWPRLPESIIHADCWAGNIVATTERDLVFIDWDTSGWGPAALDFADLLIGCHFSLSDPYSTQLELDSQRIGAVTQGYVSRRSLTAPERAVLTDAIRYGALFRGAQTFGRIEQEGWTPAIERELQRQRTRYTVSHEIGEVSQQYLQAT